MKWFNCLILMSWTYLSSAQITPQQYIETYQQIAVDEMQRTGIPASITLAQGMLETGNGNSALAVKARNHFGIKCHQTWKGPTFTQDDDEKNECFRKYKHAEDSYRDHSDFLLNGKRYAFLFEYGPTEYKKWAHGLKKAGYATNPQYAHRLIDLIEKHELHRFDLGQLAQKKSTDVAKPKHGDSKMNLAIQIGHEPKTENGVLYVVAKTSDSYESLTQELGLWRWELYKYNDVSEGTVLKKGQRVYLRPKKNKSSRQMFEYTVQKNESLWEVSQKLGIKLKKLAKRNHLNPEADLKTGVVLKTR